MKQAKPEIVEKLNDNVEKIKIKDIHTKKYLDNLKKTTYKDKKVVFILPNGKEY